MNKQLMRPSDNQMIGGVAAGLADYFDIDPVIVRLVFLLLFFGGGHGLLIYILLWVLMPAAPSNGKYRAFDEDEVVVG